MNFDIDFSLDDNFDNDDKVLVESLIYKKRIEKANYINGLKRESFEKLINKPPVKNEYYHIVSNGSFDFFTIVPVLLKHLNICNEFIGSTWATNKCNVLELFNMFDNDLIKSIVIIGGDYMKISNRCDYGLLKNGMLERNQKFINLKNHAKILLMTNYIDYYVVEGSSNWTSNPRIEQYLMTNNYDLFNFHKDWILNIIDKKTN